MQRAGASASGTVSPERFIVYFFDDVALRNIAPSPASGESSNSGYATNRRGLEKQPPEALKAAFGLSPGTYLVRVVVRGESDGLMTTETNEVEIQ